MITRHAVSSTYRETYRKVLADSGSKKTTALAMTLLVVGYFILINLKTALEVFQFNTLTTIDKYFLFLQVLFDTEALHSPAPFILISITIVLSSLVAGQYFLYLKTRGKVLARDGAYGSIGFVLVTLGVGCLACGTLLVSTLLGFFGYSSLLLYFPYHGIEIGFIGILFLTFLSYSLARRLASPLTC